MRDQTVNITFIGAGNVAWHLAPALENAGHVVQEVYSKTGRSAQKLVGKLYDAEVATDLDFSQSGSDLFIIAIPDDEISAVSAEIILPDQSILVHTSGAKPLEEIQVEAASAIGVFYPLQTFSKDRKVSFDHVPFLIESNHKAAEKILVNIAKSISKNVQVVDSQRRGQLHVSAVFACNFTNHMMRISEQLLNDAQLDFDILRPLIAETVEKSLLMKPSQSQTGPAMRGDLETLDKHMKLLESNSAYAEIYRLISQNILDTYA